MGEKQLLISFSTGFGGGFLWWFDLFWYKNVCVHSSPICLLDFEWRIPADRRDQDKIFLFTTRKTEQLWWVQAALKYKFSGPQQPPQWALKNETVPVIPERYSVNSQMQTSDAFSFSALLALP